ncbi:MAG: hypothetical protein Q9M37_03495 [Desulfonauticus sp.]|nr:hypothetical protein [Desulfonauticus sp.]
MGSWDEIWEIKEQPEVSFLGVAIDVRYPCGCVKCQKGEQKLKEMGQNREGKQLHIVVAPLTERRRLQHIFIDTTSRFIVSRLGVWKHALEKLQIPYKIRAEFESFMMGNVIEYRRTTVGDYIRENGVVDENTLKFVERTNPNVLKAQVTVPTKVVPKDAWELYGLDKETIKEKVKLYKKVWKLILEGVEDNEAYEKVFGETIEEIEDEIEKEIEKEIEEKEEKKTKKAKKTKKTTKKYEEEEEIEEEEEEIEEDEEEEEEEEELIL